MVTRLILIPFLTVFSVFGQMVEWGSSTAKFNCGSNAITDNIGPFTASLWVIGSSSLPDTDTWLLARGDAGPGWAIGSLGGGVNRINFFIDYATNDLFRVSSNGVFDADGTLHHYFITWDGSDTGTNIHIYKDGAEVSYLANQDGTGGQVDNSAVNLFIGNTDSDTRRWFGEIGCVALWFSSEGSVTDARIAAQNCQAALKLSVGMPDTFLPMHEGKDGDALGAASILDVAAGVGTCSGAGTLTARGSQLKLR